MGKFTAYRIFEENDKSIGRFVELSLDDLDPGELVIRTGNNRGRTTVSVAPTSIGTNSLVANKTNLKDTPHG